MPPRADFKSLKLGGGSLAIINSHSTHNISPPSNPNCGPRNLSQFLDTDILCPLNSTALTLTPFLLCCWVGMINKKTNSHGLHCSFAQVRPLL